MKRTLKMIAFAACISAAATSMAQPPGAGHEEGNRPGGNTNRPQRPQ